MPECLKILVDILPNIMRGSSQQNIKNNNNLMAIFECFGIIVVLFNSLPK